MQPDRAPSIDDTWFDLVPMALVEFDEVGTVLRANPAAQAALGSLSGRETTWPCSPVRYSGSAAGMRRSP